MAKIDAACWDRKYAGANPNPDFLPDPILAAHAHVFDRAGVALDVACGVGHNALFLATLGYEVIALDASIRGLSYGRDEARRRRLPVRFAVVDLDRYAPPRAYFDLVIVVKYLNRPLISLLIDALKPGGLIFYRTFNRNNLTAAPSFNPDYVLAPGEFRRHFADFELIATNDTPDALDHETYWIGRKGF